jgi:hypothetical protein
MIMVEAEGSTQSRRDKVEDAACFYIKELMPRIKNLELNIQLIPKLDEKDGVDGDCTWEDKNHRPREFTIRLNSSKSLSVILDTLAHEMIHVRQYARGELVDLTRTPGYSRFRGELIKWNPKNEPWEKEAWECSYELYERWKSYK